MLVTVGAWFLSFCFFNKKSCFIPFCRILTLVISTKIMIVLVSVEGLFEVTLTDVSTTGCQVVETSVNVTSNSPSHRLDYRRSFGSSSPPSLRR